MKTATLHRQPALFLRCKVSKKQEQGAVLIVALLLLVVLTMLGISALDATKLQTRMAANTAEFNRAFQISELGLSLPAREYGDVTNAAGLAIMDRISAPFDAAAEVTDFPDSVCSDKKPGPCWRARDDLQRNTTDKYSLEFVTVRAPSTFPNLKGGSGTDNFRVAYFLNVSRGASKSQTGSTKPDITAPRVNLKGGMTRLVPASKGSLPFGDNPS
ncbi:PilX N-terminal domain-containing pilus assembly protein [Beggiatoa leptomitoformis]|uniref:Type 4 fimbrial biogenesis protein PilX N-terminal domain-containing protein n=1 Tax=Beggiatoa leptomitoformis TaxID=288004 RepID=A0A2N9YDU6_9GAMM|nr:PilX N-terminal domain-containing pilus assembly protein [Beggiatoa leptomitoformis]AUI68626.1 hypothetical protein BLE401_07850 [Beggiatoa leptomitoformis]QGX03824.1 hypothetical protein AL038_19480 [Beggiatoa leptomitoformis]